MSNESNGGRHSLPEIPQLMPGETQPIKARAAYLAEHEHFPTFEDLAGIEPVISKLQDIVDDYRLPESSELFNEYNVSRPQTFLLRGPGGVGKTTAVRAFAKELRADLREIKPTDIADSYVGNTAKNLSAAFADAKETTTEKDRPYILFFDEFDGLFSKEAGGNSGVATQVVNELKLILNDMSAKYPNVLVVFATNEISGFNEPLLRAGRIDETLTFAMPTEENRVQIFDLLLTKDVKHFHYVPMKTTQKLSGMALESVIAQEINDINNIETWLATSVQASPEQPPIDTSEMARLTEGFSGADISKVLERARLGRLRAHRRTGESPAKTTAEELRTLILEHRKSHPNLD